MRKTTAGIVKEKHGKCYSRAYHSWQQMRIRCHNENSKRFSDYGGRGITVCESWRGSFSAFYADMGDPLDGTSIERINFGNYEPSNCRWATHTEQARNRRSNRMLEIGGQTKTMVEWSEESGVHFGTIRKRLKQGRTAEESITTVIRRNCVVVS